MVCVKVMDEHLGSGRAAVAFGVLLYGVLGYSYEYEKMKKCIRTEGLGVGKKRDLNPLPA